MVAFETSKGKVEFDLEGKTKGTKKIVSAMKQIETSLRKNSHLLDLFEGKTRKVVGATKRLTIASKQITAMSHKYGVSTSRVTSALESQRLKIDKTGQSLINARGQTVSWDKAMGKMRQQMRPFKAHLLSLMFAGMALSKTFGGMVRQVMEMTGIFEVWRGVLAMILLPILLPFSRILMRIMFYIMKDEAVRKFVGWFIVFAAALGAVVMFLAMTGLALEGIKAWAAGTALIKWFGVGGRFEKIGGIFRSMAKASKLAWFVILAVIIGIKTAIEENFGKAREYLSGFWENTKRAFEGFIEFLEGLWKIFTSFFKGDIDGVIEGVKIAFSGLWKFIKGGFWALYDVIVLIGLGAFRALIGALNTIMGGINKALKLVGVDWQFELIPKEFKGFEAPSLQAGGYIPRTGLYKLHAGETVTPAGGMGGFAPTINVYANIQSDMDIKHLADRISIEMGKTFERDHGQRAV